MADNPLFNLQLQLSGNSDDDDISPFTTLADSDEALPNFREIRCDVWRLQCIAGHFKLKRDSTLNLSIAPKHKPHQLVIQIGGTNVWYIDTPPDSEVDLLQTVEVDFVVQILGETELIFVTGEIQWSRMMGFKSSSR